MKKVTFILHFRAFWMSGKNGTRGDGSSISKKAIWEGERSYQEYYDRAHNYWEVWWLDLRLEGD